MKKLILTITLALFMSHKAFTQINQDIMSGSMIWNIKEVSFKKYVGHPAALKKADGVFLIITLNLKNTSKQSVYIDNSMLKLLDVQNNEYEYSMTGDAAIQIYGATTLFYKQCQPTILTKGKIIFEVPDNKRTYNLVVSGGKKIILK